MPQNSSTELKVMTCFRRSFQLSPCRRTRVSASCVWGGGVGVESTTDLAGRGLGEPEGPVVCQRMLDVEVILVVEDSDGLAGGRGGGVSGGGGVVAALGRDGDGGQIDLLGHLGLMFQYDCRGGGRLMRDDRLSQRRCCAGCGCG